MSSTRSTRPGHPRVSLALAAAMLLCSLAAAQLDDDEPVTILATAARTIAGKSYVEIGAMMNGTAPGGTYRVPITLLFPGNEADANGTAVVDALNTSGLQFLFADTFDPDDPENTVYFPPTPVGRVLFGDAFLAAKGYTYAAVEWNQQSLELAALIGHPQGPGAHISAQTDAPHILADLNDLLKGPPSSLSALHAVSTAIAYGESQSAGFLSEVFFHGNTTAGYDGALIQSGSCDGPCGPVPEGMKVIRIDTETDLQLYGSFEERDADDADVFRLYEVAGVSHNPTDQIDLADVIATLFPDYADNLLVPLRQNPAPISPVTRAMLEHLRRWLADDTYEPPPSVFLDGPVGEPKKEKLPPPNEHGKPTKWRVFKVNRDADGNAMGGVRLPHVRTVVDGVALGAPLGRHNGLEREAPLDFRGFAVLLSGIFVPLSQSEIDARYPTHGRYLSLVRAAADHALAEGWILAEDRAAYIHRAAHCPVGRRDLTIDEIFRCLELR